MNKPPLLRIFVALCAVSFCVALLFLMIRGVDAGLSSLLAGFIFILPQQYFALKAFRHMGARSVVKTVQNFYSAETAKLVLIATGFALVYSLYKEVDVLALITSFVILVIVNGMTPFLFDKK